MATTRKAAAVRPKRPVSPAEAVAAAVATVRAPFEAIRAAQGKADKPAESKGD